LRDSQLLFSRIFSNDVHLFDTIYQFSINS